MKIKDIKKIIEKIPDDTKVYIANTINVCGNISELDKIVLSDYSSFGVVEPCIILKSNNSTRMKGNETVLNETIECYYCDSLVDTTKGSKCKCGAYFCDGCYAENSHDGVLYCPECGKEAERVEKDENTLS